jgi:hypothetical protein
MISHFFFIGFFLRSRRASLRIVCPWSTEGKEGGREGGRESGREKEESGYADVLLVFKREGLLSTF